jgi:hypothetical protein
MYNYHGNLSYYARWRKAIMDHCNGEYIYLTEMQLECLIMIDYLTQQKKPATNRTIGQLLGIKSAGVSNHLGGIKRQNPPFFTKVSNKEGYVLEERSKRVLKKIFGNA